MTVEVFCLELAGPDFKTAHHGALQRELQNFIGKWVILWDLRLSRLSWVPVLLRADRTCKVDFFSMIGTFEIFSLLAGHVARQDVVEMSVQRRDHVKVDSLLLQIGQILHVSDESVVKEFVFKTKESLHIINQLNCVGFRLVAPKKQIQNLDESNLGLLRTQRGKQIARIAIHVKPDAAFQGVVNDTFGPVMLSLDGGRFCSQIDNLPAIPFVRSSARAIAEGFSHSEAILLIFNLGGLEVRHRLCQLSNQWDEEVVVQVAGQSRRVCMQGKALGTAILLGVPFLLAPGCNNLGFRDAGHPAPACLGWVSCACAVVVMAGLLPRDHPPSRRATLLLRREHGSRFNLANNGGLRKVLVHAVSADARSSLIERSMGDWDASAKKSL